MKKTFLIATLVLGSFPVLAEKITVGVNGMVCAFCAQGITKKFKAEKTITSVDVKLEEHRVTLETNAPMSDEQIKKIIVDAGYEVSKIERN